MGGTLMLACNLQLSRALSCHQMLASSVVNTGVGVYWLYYAGGDFNTSPAPQGIPGLQEGTQVEGLM